LNNPFKPFVVSIFDRSNLNKEKLSITDIKIYKDSIYILDYYSGLIQLGVAPKNVYYIIGSYHIGTGFYNLGLYVSKTSSKSSLAFADRNKIIEVDWSNQL
jgi:hypothetical protein